ncbi:MAG: RNA methyltransferase [Prevotella sp.]|nr:RNA methyltransferase [Prevotella sp.]
MLSKNQIKYVRALEMKKNRKREGLFVAEGPKVVGDLLRAGYEATMIFSTSERTDAQLVTEEELRRISFLQHPQEVLAIFRIPVVTEEVAIDEAQLSLALDGVQDPGNLGTIIRIADWFGIRTIFCSPDTADAFNPKVVQATMGSLAHVNVVYTDLQKLLTTTDIPIYGTLLDGKDIYHEELSATGIIVMGNEGNGISQEIRQLVNRKLLIPNFHPSAETAESLNVAIATAITCSEFRRRF